MKCFDKYGADCWSIGFVRGGITSIMESDTYEVDWLQLPKDRWYADPFILDVTKTEILLLVEDYTYDCFKGSISLLHIDRKMMAITKRKVVLELPTHLSFPNILRKDDKVYIYPESAQTGKLILYEFDAANEALIPCTTICDDVIWDSDITDLFGEPLLFTAAHNDTLLDIYKWNEMTMRFIPWKSIPSEKRNSRLGGSLFEYKGNIYYPAQDCEDNYGAAIEIKKICLKDGEFEITEIKKLTSTHPQLKHGLHTLNQYKDIVVIDVHGYRYGWVGEVIAKLVQVKKQLFKNKYL